MILGAESSQSSDVSDETGSVSGELMHLIVPVFPCSLHIKILYKNLDFIVSSFSISIDIWLIKHIKISRLDSNCTKEIQRDSKKNSVTSYSYTDKGESWSYHS